MDVTRKPILTADMLTLKRKKLVLTMLLALLSLGYFSALSHLEIHFFFKSYVAIVPLQAAAFIYVIYFRWKERGRQLRAIAKKT